jgi:flagellar biogenesis protein FliO
LPSLLERVLWAVVVLVTSGSTLAQHAPLATPSPSPEASTLIRRGSAAAAATQPASSPSTQIMDIPRVLAAMGIVIGLILALRYLAKRFIPGAQASRNISAVTLLGRSVLTPKHQVLLLQVGRRILVAADNGTQLTSLSEIDDPEEVALLMGQLDASRADSIGSSFGSLVGKAREHFTSGAPSDSPDATEAQLTPDVPPQTVEVEGARGELSSLMNKVRLLSQQFRRTS